MGLSGSIVLNTFIRYVSLGYLDIFHGKYKGFIAILIVSDILEELIFL
jgi:hypothetical protein